MEGTINNNPWLGLESYQEGEILYGRDEDIRDLIQCVLKDTETLLYGKSGIGKSSILKAGIFPAARRYGYLPVSIRLSHKEGSNYLSQIKEAIIVAMGVDCDNKDEISRRIKEIVACKDTQAETLYEFFHRHIFYDKEGHRIKLLLVFDQFEEIFTLQPDESKKRNFFAQMADMLNDIMPDSLLPKINDEADARLIDDNELGEEDIFDGIDLDINGDFSEYVIDNDIHFVFTIRMDFLSEFEYYSATIPSLRHNRYGLRPINEEQASQIILRPAPGLISRPVARLIIEKVTQRTDFKLDGLPKIEVDSAVLSLYLSRLYESRGPEGITAELIEQKGDEIISRFYEDAMADIPESSVEYLENKLINGEGRRDNITLYDATKIGGVTERDINILCNERKILRQFNYAGVTRIEYIHDILCPIVVKNKENRKQRKQIEEESQKLLKQQAINKTKLKRRNRIISILACLLVGVSLITLIAFLSQSKWTKVTVSLSEDSSINLTDYWKARVSILSGKDTLWVEDVDKSNPMFVFEAKDPDIKKMRCEVSFLIGDFVVNPVFENIIDKDFDITIPISHNADRRLISGIVGSRVGPRSPLIDATVIIDDQVAKTNYRGEFFLYVDSGMQDSTIIIRKKGYMSYEGKLKKQKGIYTLKYNGDYDYPELAATIDRQIRETDNVRILEGTCYAFINGKEVGGKAHMLIELVNDSIVGYTYYDKNYEQAANKIDTYFLINGVYNPVNNTFKINLMDAVYNEIEYTGNITNDSIWYGETFDKKHKLGYFLMTAKQ